MNAATYTKAILTGCLVAAMSVSTAGDAAAQSGPSASRASDIDVRDVVRKTFKVNSGGTLEIEADRGTVDVRPTASGEVRIEVERVVSVEREEEAKAILQMHKLDMVQKGESVMLTSRVEERRFSWRDWKGNDKMRINIVVEAPEAFNVMILTGAGNILVGDLLGELDVRSGAGNIEIGDIEGSVRVVSGSGTVYIGHVEGEADVHTGAGDIELASIAGAATIGTGAGNVVARILDQPVGASEIASGAGNVTVFLASNIGVNVDASARGNCTTDFPLRVEGRWMVKTLEGELNGGGPALAIRSAIGNVVLKRAN